MGTAYYKIQYPCGYIFEFKATSIHLSFDRRDMEFKLCPMHGKDCKKVK